MNIVIVGLNHHAAPVELRERAAPDEERKKELCEALVDTDAREAVVISTCNRTEIVLAVSDTEKGGAAARSLLIQSAGDRKSEIEDVLFTLEGTAAVRHLFEVATSLDSLVIGEPHIIGQIREDFDRASKAGTVGKVLSRLFAGAVTLAKAVRQQTALGCSPVSVSSIALDLAAKVFGSIDGKKVLVLGAGEMGRQTAILASHRGAEITVSNRTLEKAEEIAHRVKGKTAPWEERGPAMVETDIIVTSTGATTPILHREDMVSVMHARRNRQVFIIDIAVPRDVDKSVDDLYNLYRYDLDDLTHAAEENASRRKDEIPKVRAMIEVALEDFDKWVAECKVISDIVVLREVVEKIRKTELEAHLRRMHSIDERDRNIVEALTAAIVGKVLHTPTVRLKEAAQEGTDRRHAGSLRYLFGLEQEDRKLNDDTE